MALKEYSFLTACLCIKQLYNLLNIAYSKEVANVCKPIEFRWLLRFILFW